MSTATWLVVGGIHLLNGTAALRPDEPVVTVRIESGATPTWGDNTVVLRWDTLGTVELTARPAGDAPASRLRATGSTLFDRMRPGAELRALGGTAAGALVPLFLVHAVTDADATRVHVYSQIRFLAEDACFIRTTSEPLVVEDPQELAWLPEAVRLHARDALFLNNHQRSYRRCFHGMELEHKYTLDPPTADIWTLTCDLLDAVRDGDLPGHVLEYHDEFQAWDYLNHLYRVEAPEDDRGYVSFIPTTDGKNLVKRKWFAADAFSRREEHTYGVELTDAGFDDYVAGHLGVTATRLPSFRRARYDVNFESLRTGHVYGIFFDTVTLVADPEVRMQQCELEYLRSRTVLEPDADAVLDEMSALAAWLEGFLRAHGVSDTQGCYSKLSFLTDSVAAQPHLAVQVGAR